MVDLSDLSPIKFIIKLKDFCKNVSLVVFFVITSGSLSMDQFGEMLLIFIYVSQPFN